MCQSCGEERKFKCDLSCDSCKYEDLHVCGHKDRDKEDEPCKYCMDFDEWQSR